jgi:hypothetical protein
VTFNLRIGYLTLREPSRRREENAGFDDTQGTDNSSRVVLVIVALALVFIAIMTYFVAQMPRKP